MEGCPRVTCTGLAVLLCTPGPHLPSYRMAPGLVPRPGERPCRPDGGFLRTPLPGPPGRSQAAGEGAVTQAAPREDRAAVLMRDLEPRPQTRWGGAGTRPLHGRSHTPPNMVGLTVRGPLPK